MKKNKSICATCGTLYGNALPGTCIICSDDRQYVTEKGQCWTSLEQLAKDHAVSFLFISPGLQSLSITPSFAIGQRAFLVQTERGNILWDCIPLIDDSAMTYIETLGGLQAIAISRPHCYSLMNVYAGHFNCPVYLHEADKNWIMDTDDRYLRLWTGARQPLWNRMELLHTGGHFPGSTILHLPEQNTLLTGDSILVAWDRKTVTSMYSYPNLIPLPKNDIAHIIEVVSPLAFNALYSAFDGQNIPTRRQRDFLRFHAPLSLHRKLMDY